MDIIHQIIARNQGFTITIAEIVVFTVFISLILYHLLIYFGRKNFAEGKLYLCFSLLLTGFLTFIFLDTNLYFITASLLFDTGIWTTFLTGVSWAVIFYSFYGIMELLLPGEELKNIKTGIFLYSGSLIVWTALAIPSLTPYQYNAFRLMWYFTGLVIAFQVWNYVPLYAKAGKTDPEIKLIFWGVIGYMAYMWVYRLFLMSYPGKMELWVVNNILKIVMAFTFALALARKFNREYADLVVLKTQLEQKVSEKTHELLLAKEKIENESRLRTEYFIQVAHETKTPLTLIGNYLHRLEKIQGRSHELQVVQHNFGLLRDTMILFLDSEKLGKGQVVYNHGCVLALSEFIRQKIPLYTVSATDKNLLFLTDIQPGLYVKCDPLAMERILNNLVDNAIKFTDEGEIHLTLKGKGDTALIIVADNGSGIKESQLPFVFDRFFQAPDTPIASGGLGMGLYIVKKTIESLDGEICIDSQPSKGTSVKVRLPLAREEGTGSLPETGSLPKPQTPKTTFESTRKTIFLVEDHRDMSAYLVSELNEFYNVYHAHNGREALEFLKTAPAIDLILSDVMMAEVNGYQLFEALKLHPVYSLTPFIFITARSDRSEKTDYLHRGAVDYIYKPFSIDELLARIAAILKHTENQRKAGLSQAIQAIHNYMEVPAVPADKWKIFETRVRQFDLTQRQAEVLREVEKGSDYRHIAEKLHISPKTIHRHMQILFEKFGVHNKIDLLRKLFE